MSKRNKEQQLQISCIVVEVAPIDESLPWETYKQKMIENVKHIPPTLVQDGKTYSAVDCFLARMQGPLAIWSTIYCDQPGRYDPNNRPANIQAMIDKREGKWG